MAYSGSVWGIDIGQCGLKALRGRRGDDGSVVAEAFEYIEYPKLLSQQDADREELIRDAIKTFLSRNSLKGDKVAIAVSGQNGLARFIKLPPVDEKQLPDLVSYEARQQIPFALEDVVWDYQRLPNIGEEDDEFQQTEVGLFAMKRDQVMRLIKPLVDQEIEIDIVQLDPISTFNAVVHDKRWSAAEQPDAANPNVWHVIFSMGTENSDLVLTNGARVWQRNIPIGGNHFTKQLTTEMKLTFAKAEHTKRNARQAPDPRKVFQAMKPVFNDLATELQRTLGYFRGLEKRADIKEMVVAGNSLKLPGLSQFLATNIELKVDRPDRFTRMTGNTVTDDATFKENLLTFPVCYGLVLQGLGLAPLGTNLVPPEIVKQRLIRSKKPWITAMAAAVLAALAFNFSFHWRAWNSVHLDDWKASISKVQSVKQQSDSYIQEDNTLREELARLEGLGKSTVGGADGRVLWLELLRAITASLPVDPTIGDTIPSLDERPLNDRKEIFIDRIETEYFSDINQWFTGAVQQKYDDTQKNREAARARQATQDDGVQADEGDPTGEAESGGEGGISEVPVDGEEGALEGGAWVIEISGHHFQVGRPPLPSVGSVYVREKLLDQLEFGNVTLPDGKGGTVVFSAKELGIMKPVLIWENLNKDFEVLNPKAKQNTTRMATPFGEPSSIFTPRPGTPPAGNEPAVKPTINAPRFEFTVQFAWKQTTLRERLEQRAARKRAEAGDVASVAASGGP